MYIRKELVHLVLLFSIILGGSVLNASSYDEDILGIFSKVLPRFVLMSSLKTDIKKEIDICILSDEIDKFVALSLISKINANYPNGIKRYKVNIKSHTFEELDTCKVSQLIFMFDSNKKNINNTVKFSNKHQILSMSYNEALLSDGVATSLFIGRKVVPYINMKAISDNKIILDNILLRVSKIYLGRNK